MGQIADRIGDDALSFAGGVESSVAEVTVAVAVALPVRLGHGAERLPPRPAPRERVSVGMPPGTAAVQRSVMA